MYFVLLKVDLKSPLTFGKVRSDFFPQLDVAVEDDALLEHADTLQTFFTGKPSDVVTALQDVIHG